MAGFRVLLVDDEEELVSTLVERLSYRDVAADYTTDGALALEKLRETSYDVVVIDVKLPGMSGEELLQRIRRTYPDLPILMMTGHGSSTEETYVLPEGAYDFLPKPVDIEILVDRMRDAIRENERQE